MHIIPVIDLKNGAVVHARGGNRSEYHPIETPLANSADPLDVINGLLSLYPFDTLYLADLDGIAEGCPDVAMQERILETWAGSRVLIDDGRTIDQIPLPHVRHVAVLGSESLSDLSDLTSAAVLSLDFKDETFLGNPEILERPLWWPPEVIVMTLGAVGTGQGPDMTRLREIIERAGGRDVLAAGGIRNADDLKSLSRMGVKGALVATALHTGQIKTRDLEEIAGKVCSPLASGV